MSAKKTPIEIGQRFSKLTVLSFVGYSKNHSRIYRCKCECGQITDSIAANLANGNTKSCGCYRSDFCSRIGKSGFVHGRKKPDLTYSSWIAMRYRCNNQNSDHKKNYHDLGVKVCDRWNSFESFLADMGERPIGKTIDRINPFGNYEPQNCRWATPKQQMNNRRISK